MKEFGKIRIDERPGKGGWAPGDYFGYCSSCKEEYLGAKRSFFCADCAYNRDEGVKEICQKAGIDFKAAAKDCIIKHK